MPSNITDAFVGADHRAARASDDLRPGLDLLRKVLDDARRRIERVDLSAQIHRHPWPAVGLAFALGALAGRGTRRSAPAPRSRSLGGVALGAVSAIGFQFLRELALAQLGRTARRWWSEHDSGPPDEPHAGYRANIDPFLER